MNGIDISDESNYVDNRHVIQRMKMSRKMTAFPSMPICLKIVRAYFEIMFKAVLSGSTFYIPNFGRIYIIKKENKKVETYKLRKGVPLNFKRLGYHYEIVLESEHIEKEKYTFRAACSIREKLFKILRYSEQEYSDTII